MVTAPAAGDLVWLDFAPQAGSEQAGRRPALTLSPASYNDKVGLGLFCPVTRQAKGYPFEVELPGGLSLSGVVLVDQIKSLDWRVRRLEIVEPVPASTLREVVLKLQRLLPETTAAD
ncbi:MAG: endoribonuclease MazF [Armatimonadetes bacterium]|nr:endoribonuclease MazF [Armatimonadota bacterium]